MEILPAIPVEASTLLSAFLGPLLLIIFIAAVAGIIVIHELASCYKKTPVQVISMTGLGILAFLAAVGATLAALEQFCR